MKILHINKYHYIVGGACTVYFNTAKLLERHGHSSVFFSTRCPEHNLPCETSEFFVPYVDLNVKEHSIANQLQIAGRFIYSFDAKKRLSRLLDKYPIDIAHLHLIYHHISPSILHELKKRKIPVVMTLHDYKMVCGYYAMLMNGKHCEDCCNRKYYMAVKNRCFHNSFFKSMLTSLEMYLHHKVLDIYDNVDIFISPSKYLIDKHREMGFKKELVHLPNFIDTEEFKDIHIEKNNRKDSSVNSFVYVGRVSEEKGLRTLVDAAKHLVNENKYGKMEIIIVGDGPIREELQDKAKKEGISNVKFTGYLDGSKLYQEIKKSMALILPSECYENNPLSVIEAFALVKPVIGARIAGIPELVKDYETGLTFESRNSKDLSDKIKYFMDHPEKVAEMGENGRNLVEGKLGAETHYRKLMEIYKKAIEKSSSKKYQLKQK